MEPTITPSPKTHNNSPLVSIVVTAYNHLDYTKKCIESLYDYTKDIDFELITINNGSSDGTREYFNSLEDSVKIDFEENAGVDKAINYGFRIAKGKYTLNLSNDIVVTRGWLNNLIICMESDEKIGMAVPVCGFSSNAQQVNLPYTTLEEMQVMAALYNISNPNLWEERLRLVTYTCIFRTDVQKSIGGFDEDFNPGGYDDDAISFTIRRMGYKLILAKDTYVHHYGSITFNVEYTKNNLAVRNRSLFLKKFKVDSYTASLIDFNVVNLLHYSKKEELHILGIGASCGSTLLQIKNEYKKTGNTGIHLSYLTEHPYCIPDLRTICDSCFCGLAMDISMFFKEAFFDYIIVESEVSSITDIPEFYAYLPALLKSEGCIVGTAPDENILLIMKEALQKKGLSIEKNIENYYYLFS